MSSQPLYSQVRAELARRIEAGELTEGDRLPSERALQVEFDCARSVIRQALAALSRDGWVMAAYPRGYMVLGPRIPWISRLQLLSDESWDVSILDAEGYQAPSDVAEALEITERSAVARRDSLLQGAPSGEPWGLGWSWYPLDPLDAEGASVVLDPGEIGYDDLERAFGRHIIGYRERIRARVPSKAERSGLAIDAGVPVIEVARISRTTTKPISFFVFVGRADRFEADYFIEKT